MRQCRHVNDQKAVVAIISSQLTPSKHVKRKIMNKHYKRVILKQNHSFRGLQTQKVW